MSVSDEGQDWHLGQQFLVNCQTNFWKSLLFINNYSKSLEEIVSQLNLIIQENHCNKLSMSIGFNILTLIRNSIPILILENILFVNSTVNWYLFGQ